MEDDELDPKWQRQVEWLKAKPWERKKLIQKHKAERIQAQIKNNRSFKKDFTRPVKRLSIQEYYEKKAHEGNLRSNFQPRPPRKTAFRKTKIYALCDPDVGIIRYVGKSNFPERRYESHLQDISGPKARWIKELLANGKRPVLKILEECDYAVWESRERYWIAEFRKTQVLFNRTAGGDQSYGTEPRRDTPKSSVPRN